MVRCFQDYICKGDYNMATDHNIPSLNGLEPLPFHWGHRYFDYLPTSFDDSLSFTEQIAQLMEYLNKMHRLSDELVSQWEEIKEWIMNDGVTDSVEKVMQQWIKDGTIAKLISENVLTSIWDAIKALASGSPKGTFPNYAALVSAYPNGDNGIYITTDTGHWWYWSDAAWHDGGQYQSTGIADDSIKTAMIQDQAVTNRKINDIDTNKISDGYSDNGDAVPYNQAGGLTIDGQNLVLVKSASGDMGIKIHVEMPIEPTINNPYHLKFKYRTLNDSALKDNVNVYAMLHDGTIKNEIWDGKKSAGFTQVAQDIDYLFYQQNNMSREFYLLFMIHGGAGTLNITDININLNNNADPVPTVIEKAMRSYSHTNNGYGVTNDNVGDNYLDINQNGVWNGHDDGTTYDKIIIDDSSENIVYRKIATGDSGAFFKGHLPHAMQPWQTLTLKGNYRTVNANDMSDKIEVFIDNSAGNPVTSTLATISKTDTWKQFTISVGIGDLTSLGITSDFSLLIVCHGGAGLLNLMNLTVNISGLALKNRDRAVRLGNLQRETGNFNRISYESISDNLANFANAKMWNNDSGDRIYYDYDSENIVYRKTGSQTNVGIMVPAYLPKGMPNDQRLIIEVGYSAVAGNTFDDLVSGYLVDEFGNLNHQIFQRNLDSGAYGVSITKQELSDYGFTNEFWILVAFRNGTGQFSLSHVAVNFDRGEQTLTELMTDWHNANNAALNLEEMDKLGQLSKWNDSTGSDTYYHFPTSDRIDYVQRNENNSKDKGFKILFNRSAFDPEKPLYLNFEGMRNDLNVRWDMSLWNSEMVYKKDLGPSAASLGFTSQQIILQPSELDSFGITGAFYISFNTHATGAQLKLRGLSLSNTNIGRSLVHSLNMLQTENGKINRTEYGQYGAYSDTTNWTKQPVSNLKLVTPYYPATEDSLLQEINVNVSKAGTYKLIVGTIDQHMLLVNETDYSVALVAGDNTVDLSEQGIIVKKGQQVFFDRSGDQYGFQDIGHNYYYPGYIQDNTQSTDPTYTGYIFHNSTYPIGFAYNLLTLGSGQQTKQNTTDIQTLSDEIAGISTTTTMTAPSGTKYRLVVHDDGSLHVVPVVSTKVVFLGNSLTKERGNIGMCASDQYHDYYYLTSAYIKAKNANVSIADRQNIAAFEMTESTADRATYVTNSILPLISADTDLIIIQLIDNVNTDARLATFQSDSIDMVKKIRAVAPDAHVLWVGGWFADNNKMGILKNICNATGAELVNIYDLGQDATLKGTMGMTRTGTDGTTWQVTNSGEAAHPGDAGMAKIASRIEDKLGY